MTTAMKYKVGDRVKLKTKEELLATGWRLYESEFCYTKEINGNNLIYELPETTPENLIISEIVEHPNFPYKIEGIAGWQWCDDLFSGLAETSELKNSGSKYHRTVKDLRDPCKEAIVDVYTVLDAFNVCCPARQHAIKKLLCSGIRGKGDVKQDLIEALDAVKRAIELQENRK